MPWRRPGTAKAWVRSQVSPFGNCGGQSGIERGQYHSTDVQDFPFIHMLLLPEGKPAKSVNLLKNSAFFFLEMAEHWM